MNQHPIAPLLLAVCLLGVCLAAPPPAGDVPETTQELRHRGLAGFGYRELTDGDSESMGLEDPVGILVTRILPDMPAERAGLREGDVIVSYGGHTVRDVSALLDVTRQCYAGDEVEVSVKRGGRQLSLVIALTTSLETSDEVDVEYTSFTSGDVRLRAVITSPTESDGKKLPALLLVSALGSPRLIDSPVYSMRKELAHAAARGGFRAMRFELRGHGDSEGEDFRTTDFLTELGDNLAALDYLTTRSDVDESRIFVMGHSTGGMVAAAIAAERDLSGIIVSCTVGRTFYERMGETVRLQSEFSGDPQEEIDRNVMDYMFLTVAVARGEALLSILERHPTLSRFVNSNDRLMDDRTVDYWRQQLNLNLGEIYGRITEPVLIVYARSDFLTQLACHERVEAVLAQAGNKDVTLSVIDNLDHMYAYARDKKASYDHYQTRSFHENPTAREQIIEWLKRRAN